MGRAYLWLILIVYSVLVSVWCFLGRWLGTRPLIFRLIDRWADRVVPAAFILLGAYVLNSP